MFMKRILVIALALSTFSVSALAQDWAKATLEKSPRHQEWVTVKHDNRVVHAFVVYPEIKKKAPAVIVIHEIFGLTDWVRSVADKLAAEGYIAIAPDLLSGFGPGGKGSEGFASADDRVKAVSELDPETVTADLKAVADYVEKLPSVNGKLAVAGFCWGGGQSFRFATNRPELRAAFVFYGTPPNQFASIQTPVYGFYAGNDNRIDATLPDTQTGMNKAGKSYDPVIYKGAGHGFMRMGQDPGNTGDSNKKAHDEAWKRWLHLLKEM
jgi:carboxymethylenebutenolidase